MSFFLKNGDVFSGCRILQKCGQGAYGIVYLAENAVGQKIVIKIVVNTDDVAREMRGLRNYMKVSGAHPNLLQVFHVGEMEDGFYYTMEAADNLAADDSYIPATLGNELRQGRKFTPEEAVHTTRNLLDGVKVIHDAGLVHRDIKPDNIIFVNGVPKLSDPGLVAPAGSKMSLAGTPGFIPPEVIVNDLPVNVASDLYAIGKVFYCMATGSSPSEYPHLPSDMRIEVRRQIFPVLSQMCNNNPAKRFKSVDEFLHKMPERIKEPTRWERFRSDFRDWKILNAEKYRRLVCGLSLLAVLLACGCSFLVFQNWQRTKEINAAKSKVRAFQLINRDREKLAAFQFETFFPDNSRQYKKFSGILEKQLKSGKWVDAAGTVDKFSAFLRTVAEAHLPEIPDDPGGFRQSFEISGAARSFLAAPLAGHLEPGRKAAYIKKLEKLENDIYTGWKGPRCDKDWFSNNYYSHPHVFVPAGAVKMAHNGKTVKIPYHFWICKYETMQEIFHRSMRISPQKSNNPKGPVERLSWNDVLHYCQILTQNLKNDEKLPPGYIVRPPTEAEWEYAAGNAWMGADTVPFEERALFNKNSGGQTHTVGTKQPNRLGIYDIYGNVSEMVIPFEKPAMSNSIILRGGSYCRKKSSCFKRTSHHKFQSIPDDIGFRVVIAPGDMSFFDEQFYISGPTTVRYRGKVYELIGSNLRAYSWHDARHFCEMLGGRLGEIEDQKQLDFFRKHMPLVVGFWPCLVNGKKVNGKWIWMNSGRVINFGKWFSSRLGNEGKYLTVTRKSWVPVGNFKSSIFLCEWDEKDYPNRNLGFLSGKKSPLELTRFSIGDKNYVLIKSSMLWNTAVRFSELLGCRLACPDTPELKKAIIEKLKDHSDIRILLGGYAKFGKWYWLSGKEIREKLSSKPFVMLPSRNRNFVVLKGGKFWDCQSASAFLLEWSGKLASSN